MSTAGTIAKTKSVGTPEQKVKVELKGLCVNCNNAEHCSYARNATKPVVYCEMHDAFAPEPSTADLSEVLRPDPSELRPELPLSKGLCVNCANRGECVYAKREGGVWHCEEYR